jgi:LmbE family N-acetylglucosaminyl deacetylase
MDRTRSKSAVTSRKHPELKRLKKFISTPAFARYYMFSSLFILLATTLFWSIKSALINLSNADQLINPYLFQNSSTFHNAQFPGAHTFLFKWPLFYLIKLFGFSSASYDVVTVGVVLLTIAALAYILYRIEKRPLVLGTLLLALASVLLLIPAQPYPGGLLPVNLGMLTTRNLEYILYILSLVLLIRSPRVKSRQFWLGILCLSLLIASDKLFLSLSVGGGVLALLFYSLIKKWGLVSLSAKWLLSSVIAGILGTASLWFIAAMKITHIVGQTSADPYGAVSNLHNALLAAVYSVTGLFTNFGANPANETTILRQIPHQTFSHIFGLGGLAYLVNAALLLAGLFFLYKIWISSFSNPKRRVYKPNDDAYQLVLLSLFSSIAAFLVFIVSNHDYAVDARYLTITFFTVFIAAAVFAQRKKWKAERIVICGLIILASVVFGMFAANRSYRHENAALSVVNHRNAQIADALNRLDGKEVLVGDYWRVLPIKFKANKNLRVMPLGSCAQPRIGLSSQAWNYNLNKQGFDYLLSLDTSLTDFHGCTLPQLVVAYGHPNSSTLIAGSLTQPQELLLHYDNGAQISGPIKKSKTQAGDTITPIALSDLSDKPCDTPTIMTVIAHQDDDLLFMNPDTLHNVRSGYCMRTIYLTAGDAGTHNSFYWLGREQGAEAAYNYMSPNSSSIWEERIVKLANNEYVVIANPRGNTKISLIFMRLPDGNTKGQGFPATNFESLLRLQAGKISFTHSVDGQSQYSSADLVNALDALLHFYQPTEIHTQANYISTRYVDHSDHMAVGRYMKQAYAKYETEQFNNQVVIPIKYYTGYPTHAFPTNVSGQDLADKTNAYLAYANFDGAVCKSIHQCNFGSTFGYYLTRQYQNPY